MPFSTYLNEPKSHEARPGQIDAQEQQVQQQQQRPQNDFTFPQSSSLFPAQESYPGYSPSDAMKQFGSYYAGPAPTNSPIGANSSAGPSSIGSTGSTSSSGKAFYPSSPSPRSAGGAGPGNSGLFQMPSFLMGGGFGGTLAPGGGAEVINPSIYDFVSTPYAPSFDNEKSWLTSKFNTLEEQKPELERRDDVEGTGSSHVHAHTSAASGSPFGYLNVDSPQERPPLGAQDEGTGEPSRTMSVAQVELTDSGGSGGDGTEGAVSMHPPLYVPEPNLDLPLYSQSGFDMLSILGRVATRPNPTIKLGPVDLTCAFVVADVRRNDSPIVYASRTFCDLTGYTESEILGRNCRFLQAPGGRVARSEARRFTSAEAVRELWLALDKDREVQVSLINYRKDGKPFVNRVSIVPIPADDGSSEIAFHVGFQVDLNEQPGLIAQRIQDGKFYSNTIFSGSLYGSLRTQTPAERSARAMGQKLRTLLADPSFQTTTPLNTSCNNAPSAAASNSNLKEVDHSSTPKPSLNNKPESRDERQWLNLLLLEHMPDFLHVLSLKGHFLYVSPGITRVLGYAPSDLIGKSVGDFCHPSDAVPLLRELKESTGQLSGGLSEGSKAPLSSDAHEAQTHMGLRTVDLLFRMRTKAGGYMWIESIGRLHIEAGKGRKAIVLSGRMCALPNLKWGAISQAGGILGQSSPRLGVTAGDSGEAAKDAVGAEKEFWAMLCEDGLFLVAGMGARDLLGWGAAEMIGRSIHEFILEGEDGASAEQVLTALGKAYNAEMDTQSLSCRMKRRDGEPAWMQLMLYANESRSASGRIIVQFKLLPFSLSSSPVSPFPKYSPTTFQNTHYSFLPPSASSSSLPMHSPTTPVLAKSGRISHAPSSNVFSEFETHRGTSWQYELQQLKYANDKLREEVEFYETRQREHQRTPWQL